MTNAMHRIGYWWSEKKSTKLNISELETLLLKNDCQLIKIHLDRSLEEQGPFSVIIHKLSDIIVKADQGDANAKRAIQAFENYVRKHPEITVLDPLDNVRTLLDRYNQYRLIEESGLAKEDVVFTPAFVHLTSNNIDVNRGRIKRSKVTFPLVCKPILAHGSTAAHQMCIIFNETGLKDVKPPCVAQSFVNHNARLFKLFVIKYKYYVIERPSLKNFQACERDTVFFYSHDISKPNSASSLTELDEQDQEDSKTSPCRERLDRIVEVFSDKLGLTFYGIDIIIENCTSRYAIIDMNTFPGYDGVDDFPDMFKEVILDAISPRGTASSHLIKPRKATDTDSGIEST